MKINDDDKKFYAAMAIILGFVVPVFAYAAVTLFTPTKAEAAANVTEIRLDYNQFQRLERALKEKCK